MAESRVIKGEADPPPYASPAEIPEDTAETGDLLNFLCMKLCEFYLFRNAKLNGDQI